MVVGRDFNGFNLRDASLDLYSPQFTGAAVPGGEVADALCHPKWLKRGIGKGTLTGPAGVDQHSNQRSRLWKHWCEAAGRERSVLDHSWGQATSSDTTSLR